jgi:hypothetical protein
MATAAPTNTALNAVINSSDRADPIQFSATQPVAIDPSVLPMMLATRTKPTRRPTCATSVSTTFCNRGKLAPIAMVGGPTSIAGSAPYRSSNRPFVPAPLLHTPLNAAAASIGS